MGRVMQDESSRERGDAVADLVDDLGAFVRERGAETLESVASADESAVCRDATHLLAREFDAAVGAAEDDDPVERADETGVARPFRPAIHLE